MSEIYEIKIFIFPSKINCFPFGFVLKKLEKGMTKKNWEKYGNIQGLNGAHTGDKYSNGDTKKKIINKILCD